VSEYQQARANEESVLEVQAGEQLSEYQALQALLLPSANNIAVLLARWSLGSADAFVARMNARAHDLSLKQTRFADASGISPQTVSVPADLVKLGMVAMANDVISDIVGQPDATLPVAGKVYNVNGVLGTEGIVGVKTGNVLEVGAVYLAAATHELSGGRRLLVFAAVQGLPTRDDSFRVARALLAVLRQSLQVQRVVSKDQVVGRYAAPWGGNADIVAAADLDLIVLPGTPVRARLAARPVRAPAAPGPPLGALRVQAADRSADVPVSLGQELEGPTPLWRLTRLG
jgi:D-alanyl-D-alanine carboxypeptidase (penicillin-binding protein 5/6)